MTIKIRLWKSSFVSRRASDLNANEKASRVFVENNNNNNNEMKKEKKKRPNQRRLRVIVYKF